MNQEVQIAAIGKIHGENIEVLPQDLYIPPDALEIYLEAFEGPLDLLLYLIRKHNLDISQITTLVVINVVIGFVLSGIDWRAHLGGLAAGAFITWVLINATSLKGKNQQ